MPYLTAEAFEDVLLKQPLETVVREYLFKGVPYVFANRPKDYDLLRRHLSRPLNVKAQNVVVVGSAKVGFSLNPENFPRRFYDESDIDVLVVDQSLFDKVWKAILAWHYLRRYSGLDGPERKWAGDRKKEIYWGWLEPDKISFRGLLFPKLLAEVRDVSTCWFNAFRSLSHYPKFAGRDVSGRLYRSWDHALLYHTEGLRQIREGVR